MDRSRKQIFNGKLLKFYVEKKKFPNGYIANLEIVEHPGAVLIVPFVSKDRIVLIKQYRPVINANIWELPAGTLHKGEPAISCAKRELVEEIGYEARLWKKLGIIYPAPGYTTEKIIIYAARGLKKVETELQEDEIITSRIFAKKYIARLLNSKKIIDAKTICALTLAHIL